MFRLRGSRVKNLDPEADYPERWMILWGGARFAETYRIQHRMP